MVLSSLCANSQCAVDFEPSPAREAEKAGSLFWNILRLPPLPEAFSLDGHSHLCLGDMPIRKRQTCAWTEHAHTIAQGNG
jgi:hypothetical protein